MNFYLKKLTLDFWSGRRIGPARLPPAAYGPAACWPQHHVLAARPAQPCAGPASSPAPRPASLLTRTACRCRLTRPPPQPSAATSRSTERERERWDREREPWGRGGEVGLAGRFRPTARWNYFSSAKYWYILSARRMKKADFVFPADENIFLPIH
jgi:hypothetical protein